MALRVFMLSREKFPQVGNIDNVLNSKGKCLALPFAALALALSGGGAHGARQVAGQAQAPSAGEAALRALRDADSRVNAVFFRLAVANLPLCPKPLAASGIVLQDIAQFPAEMRVEAQAVFRFESPISIEIIVPGSPADRAGLSKDDGIIAINHVKLDELLARIEPAGMSDRSSYTRMREVRAVLARALDAGPVTIGYRRRGVEGEVSLNGTPGCPASVQVQPADKKRAGTDGKIVQITTALADFTAAEEDQLAAVLAHEFAHVILEHRPRLDAAGVKTGLLRSFGKNKRLIRRTEEEADILSVYLLVNAGYDPMAAVRFWKRFGKFTDFGFLSDGTHANSRERIAVLERTIAEVSSKPRPVVPEWALPPFASFK